MKKLFSVLLAVMMIVALAACGSTTATEETEGTESLGTIKIGYVGDLTGSTNIWGQAGLEGCYMAVEDINAAGGVLGGYMLEMDPQDGKGEAADSVNGFRKAVADGCVASIGTNFSSCNIPMAAAADELQVVALATAASNELVTIDEDGNLHPYSFRMCFIDSYQGTIAGQVAYMDLGYETADILISQDNAYSTGLAPYVEDAYTAAGGTVLNKVQVLDADTDFRTVLATVKADNPDVLFILLSDYAKIAMCAQQAREIGLECAFMGTDGWDSRDLLEKHEGALDGAYYISRVGYNSEEAAEFGARYAEEYDHEYSELETEALYGYDCVSYIAQGIEAAGSADPTAIRDAMEAMTEFDGVMGHMILDPTTHNPSQEVAIFQINGTSNDYIRAQGLR